MNNYAEQIKASVTTRELCAQVGLRVERNGSALCPFHGDRRTPSLKVYQDPARGWHCFGCGAGGSVIDFAMRWYGIDFRQAIARLDADFGLGLPLTREAAPAERRAAREEARRRALDRDRGARARAAAEAAYWACFDRYLACARMTDAHRPQKAGDGLDVRYAAALRALPELRDEYERALDALSELRAKRGGRNAGRPGRRTA